jgi:hypothetical protein
MAARSPQRSFRRAYTVVVTHHAPSVLSLARTETVNHLDAAYANRWEVLMEEPDTVWLHGHTHLAVDYTFKGTRVIANPRVIQRKRPGLILSYWSI